MRAPRPNYGPFETEQAALSAIVGRLVQALDPKVIYLFGSRARGDATPLSDFDILVITSSDDDHGPIELKQAYAPVEGLGIACEIIPCTLADFEREKHERTGICRTIAEEGMLIYERR